MVSVEFQQVSQWADKLAIQEIIYRYSDAVTRRDWDQFETVWAPDAVWEVGAPFDVRAEGYPAVRGAVGNSLDRFEFSVQTAHNPVVALSSDGRATATTTIHEIGRSAVDGRGLVLYGIYYDQLVNSEEGWRFVHRLFQPIYLESESLAGQTIKQSRLLS